MLRRSSSICSSRRTSFSLRKVPPVIWPHCRPDGYTIPPCVLLPTRCIQAAFFFNRYYEDGDLLSKRRYKEGVYAIPYVHGLLMADGKAFYHLQVEQISRSVRILQSVCRKTRARKKFKDYTLLFSDGDRFYFQTSIYAIPLRARTLPNRTSKPARISNNKRYQRTTTKDSKRTFMLFTEDEENYPGIKRFEYDPDAAEIVIRFVYDIPADKKKEVCRGELCRNCGMAAFSAAGRAESPDRAYPHRQGQGRPLP